MESNLSLVSPKPVLGLTQSPKPTTFSSSKQHFGIPLLPRKSTGSLSSSTKPRSRTVLFAFRGPRKPVLENDKNGKRLDVFASTSNSRTTTQETTSVGVNPPQPYLSTPPPSQFGSPLFWIGVGVGFSALFSFLSARVKDYARQQTFKFLMNQAPNNQFSNGPFSPGSPFGFPSPSASGPGGSAGFPFQQPSTSGQGGSASFPFQQPSTSGPSTSAGPPYPSPATSGPSTVTGSTWAPSSASSSGPNQATSSSPAASEAAVDVSATEVKSAESRAVKDETDVKTEAKRPAFVDVSPEETLQKSAFEDSSDSSSQKPSMDAEFAEVVQNGAASKEASTSNEGMKGSGLNVEALEKLLEDPTMREMIYPHLPEEMRNPETMKWMLQNPLYRQQLQDMLDNMTGGSEWNNKMMETLKDFNFDNPEVKQQFDQLGLTPQEVVSKIMANPDVAMAFQNPRVQQAIMECSQNPMNMVKYQNDQEVMAVFNKISHLFFGSAGPGGF